MTPRVVFFIPSGVTPLDLVGPWQVFQAAGLFGHPYRLEVCALTETVPLEGNLHFANLVPFRKVKLGPDDTLFVAGLATALITPGFLRAHEPVYAWIRQGLQAGTTLCSVCTGAFLLAEAGILDGLECATHYEDVEPLQRKYPRIKVRKGVLFVESGRIFTSAGIASGIDLAIHLIGLRHGQRSAFQIAQYLLIYLRRSGNFEQDSIYLRYRDHLDDVVHRAQGILIENLEKPPSLPRLAEQVGASPRTLSRRFRRSIGLSVGEYLQELRIERARSLLQEDGSKVEDVAQACGFSGGRQLRNLYRGRLGRPPRAQGPVSRAARG